MLEEPEAECVVHLVEGADDGSSERLMFKAMSFHGTKIERSTINRTIKALNESSDRFGDRSG